MERSRFPMPSTVGEARGVSLTRLHHSRAPISSKDCRMPPEVPLGLATTSWLVPVPMVPAALVPKLVPGIASTAVRVG